jgi:hypothetical protein
MSKMSNIDYLMFKVRGRIVKVDPDIYYKIRNPGYERPRKKYNGDITEMRLSKDGYPIIVCGEKTPQRHIVLSRFVMDAPKGKIVDHINRDPLDNRRQNLRIVTPRQNCLNKTYKNNSGFIGVSCFSWEGRHYCTASHRTKEDNRLRASFIDTAQNRIIAALARDKFVLQTGDEEYAPLNFPYFRKEPFRSFLLAADLRAMAKRDRQKRTEGL